MASIILLSPLLATETPPFGLSYSLGGGHSFVVPSTAAFQTPDFFTYGHGTLLYAEYLPKVVNQKGHEINPDWSVYTRLSRHGLDAQALSSARCTLMEPPNTPFETLQLTFHVDCNKPTRLALPVSYNPDTQLSRVSPGGSARPIPYIHLATDPRIVVDVASGPETIRIDLPTIWRVLF